MESELIKHGHDGKNRVVNLFCESKENKQTKKQKKYYFVEKPAIGYKSEDLEDKKQAEKLFNQLINCTQNQL